ncbi:carboxypeptidase-like regulatory domain-containing protein [Bacteroidales bacterium OttesenSCG-928-L03]|nr:carboxypeptidase-like regulatory domain-containing protein [Bacteroidales bacterium OttesenSCG-928-L03]
MNKTFFLAIPLWLITLFAFSQNRVTGTIEDEKGNPIEYATVYINASTKGTYSDAEGRFER